MMKKLFSVVAIVVLCINVQAQQFKIGKAITVANNQKLIGNNNVASGLIDTLMPASVLAGGCDIGFDSLKIYEEDAVAPHDSGYIFGTGIVDIGPGPATEFSDIAQKYNIGATAANVTNVLVLAYEAHGTVSTTVAKIYSENATTKAPDVILGTSTPIPMSAYSTTGFTNFTFATPVAVAANANFFADITIPPFGGTDKDTLAIYSTKYGCSSVDSLSWVNIFGTWYDVKSNFEANLDLMIFPVISFQAGINSYVSKGDLFMYAAFPNPATNSININFSLNSIAKIDIDVYDLSGNILKSIKNESVFSIGKHAVQIDLTNFESGSYFYSITANGNKMFSKFIITK